ncbi:6438_t:CDS:2, partial [Cetraspora pellucida]
MLDAPFTCIADAETLSTLIEKNQELRTIAIQEYKVISFNYIIRCGDGKTKVPVKIKGDNPARKFIKAIEKEVEQCQDFLRRGHIIQNSAKKLIKMLQSEIISEEIAEDYITKYKKLILLKHYLKGLYQAHKRDPLGPFGKEDNFKKVRDHDHITSTIEFDAHLIFQAMGRISREKISTIPYNMESYLTLDIGNQRYIDSLQLMPGSLDSHISNLKAEPCKEEVNKDGNSLNLLCKKPSHLYRIDSDRCFAYLERFSITREHKPKGKDDLVFHKALFLYDWFNIPEKIDATSLSPIEAFDNYHDFYLNLDILLLADCLERFCKLMKGKFGLDIAHYVSLSSFAEDALYKTTEQEIELFTDDNMYLFCEKDLFNKITKWKIPDNAEKGYILEVDFDYPYKLHKAHTSYPLASENIKISKEEI